MARSLTAGTLSIVILAILAGLVGMYAVQTLLAKDEDPEEPEVPQQINVPIASTDLPAGRPIGLGDIALMPVDPAEIEKLGDTLTMMLDADQIIGRVPRPIDRDEDGTEDKVSILQGKPFFTTDLYLEGQAPDISSLIKAGQRAVTLTFPDLQRGMVNMGDIVDVLFRSAPREGTETQLAIPETTITLLSEIKVVSTDFPRILDPQAFNEDELPPPTVTLAVSLEDAKKLQAVKGRGDLQLVPRNPDEPAGTMVAATGQTLEDILGIEPPPVPQIEVPEPAILFTTEVFRRSERSLNMFREEGKPAPNEELQALPTFDPSILEDKKNGGAKNPVPPAPVPPMPMPGEGNK